MWGCLSVQCWDVECLGTGTGAAPLGSQPTSLARVFSYGRQVVLQRHRVTAAGLALTRKQLG